MRALVLAAAFSGVAVAQEEPELNRIPAATETPATETPAPKETGERHVYVEDAMTLAASRSLEAPFPAPAPSDAQNRTSLDLSMRLHPAPSWTLTASDRADLIFDDGSAALSSKTLRNALRELSLSWEAWPRVFLEAGRINVRNGDALGYNPTDFFRPRTLVGQSSLDPSVLRKNRLGVAMLRAQVLWDGGSASVAYAPKLAEPSAIGEASVGLDPRFDATNAAHRGLAETNFNLGDLGAQALVYLEDGRSKLGVNLTLPIGQSVIAYAEWAGGPEKSLIARAVDFGRRTGTLPAGAPSPLPTDTSSQLANDLAAGASWTLGTSLTLNLEYHLHTSGLSGGDWDRWFDAARATPMLAPSLWYVRGYAADQLEPVGMHQLFVRAAWPNAAQHLDLDGFGFVSLLDGSVLAQVTASYYLSESWTTSLSASANLGAARSERGSLPQVVSGVISLVRYL